jgi:hypothetical protein
MLILGIGAFKPNVSTQVGDLYPRGDPRRDRAYSIFYVGINIGALLAPLVCGSIAVAFGWHMGFAAAGVAMLISIAIYLRGLRWLAPDRVSARRTEPHAKDPLSPQQRGAVIALISVCAFVSLFWAAYDQQGNTIVLWAEDFTERSIDLLIWQGEIPTAWFLALNPLMIFVFTPLVVRLWTWQSKRGSEAVLDPENGLRLPHGRPRQSAHGRCCLDRARRRQAQPAVAHRLFRPCDDRGAFPGSGRARADLEGRAGRHAVDDHGRVVCGHAAGRHSGRLARRILDDDREGRFFPVIAGVATFAAAAIWSISGWLSSMLDANAETYSTSSTRPKV